jgi:hypothetical protein
LQKTTEIHCFLLRQPETVRCEELEEWLSRGDPERFSPAPLKSFAQTSTALHPDWFSDGACPQDPSGSLHHARKQA